MDNSECAASFSEVEIRRFLDEKTYNALDRIRTENEVREVILIDAHV